VEGAFATNTSETSPHHHRGAAISVPLQKGDAGVRSPPFDSDRMRAGEQVDGGKAEAYGPGSVRQKVTQESKEKLSAPTKAQFTDLAAQNPWNLANTLNENRENHFQHNVSRAEKEPAKVSYSLVLPSQPPALHGLGEHPEECVL
jgi:hypothetical protein